MGMHEPRRNGAKSGGFGGYSTIDTITQTTRFRAAVATVPGFSDLFYFYSIMLPSGDAYRMHETEYDMGGATPWSNPGAYLQVSPFFHLDRVQTPLLMIAAQ